MENDFKNLSYLSLITYFVQICPSPAFWLRKKQWIMKQGCQYVYQDEMLIYELLKRNGLTNMFLSQTKALAKCCIQSQKFFLDLRWLLLKSFSIQWGASHQCRIVFVWFFHISRTVLNNPKKSIYNYTVGSYLGI